MKLRSQILAIGLAGAGTAVLVGVIGLASVSALSTSVDQAILAGRALQSSQDPLLRQFLHGQPDGPIPFDAAPRARVA